MLFDYSLAGLVTLGLLAYLVWALLRPERSLTSPAEMRRRQKSPSSSGPRDRAANRGSGDGPTVRPFGLPDPIGACSTAGGRFNRGGPAPEDCRTFERGCYHGRSCLPVRRAGRCLRMSSEPTAPG